MLMLDMSRWSWIADLRHVGAGRRGHLKIIYTPSTRISWGMGSHRHHCCLHVE